MDEASTRQLHDEVYVPVKNYFERLLDAMQKQNDLRFDAISHEVDSRFASTLEAVRTFNAANEKRNDVANEFRSTIEDQQATFSTKSEMNTVVDRISQLERAGAAGQERFPTRTEWAATEKRVTGLETAQATAVEKFIKREDLENYDRRIMELEKSRAANEGKAQQSQLIWGVIVVVVSLAIKFLPVG